MTTITIDRAVVEEALKTLEYYQRRKLEWDFSDELAVGDLRAALAQQAEPEGSVCARCGALAFDPVLPQQAEPVEPVAWKQGNLVTFNEDPYPALGGLFVQFWDGEEVAARVYANDLETIRQRCAKVNTAPPQQVAQQAEPLNLSDPAVQKRLAAQWGYVPAAQAEPVGPVAQFDLNTMPGQADAHLRALLRYTENFYATAIEHGMRAGPTANAIAHVERAGKALHQIVHAQAKMLEPARPVEPVAPVEPVEPVATLIAQRDALLEALKKADHFITNGIELGFIRMPDADTPDTAHETPGIVRAAIKSVEGEKT